MAPLPRLPRRRAHSPDGECAAVERAVDGALSSCSRCGSEIFRAWVVSAAVLSGTSSRLGRGFLRRRSGAPALAEMVDGHG